MISLTLVFSGRSFDAALALSEEFVKFGYETQIPNPAQGRVVARRELEHVPSAEYLTSFLNAMHASNHGIVEILVQDDAARLDINPTFREDDRHFFSVSAGKTWVNGDKRIAQMTIRVKPGVDHTYLGHLLYGLRDQIALFFAMLTVGRYIDQTLSLLHQRNLAGVERKLETIQRYCAVVVEGGPIVVMNGSKRQEYIDEGKKK